MEKDIINLLPEIYDKSSEIIKGVEFTPREIDIISCILSGRTSKKSISSFLYIQPKTVESHTRNIMLKLGCSSWNNIREFIEKSGKDGLIRQHYKYLLIQREFEKSLKQISNLVGVEDIKYSLFFNLAQDEKGSFIQILENDLSYAGITIVKDAPNSLIIWLGKKNTEINDEKLLASWDIIFEKPETYYFSVFDILKKILSNKNVENISTEFKKQYNIIQGSVDLSSFPILSNSTEYVAQKIFPLKRKKGTIAALSIFIFIIMCVIFFMVKKDGAREISQEYEPIRSDLIIPTSNALLNRPDLIKQIHSKLKKEKANQSIVLIGLVGMGGVGKTTLARYYARAHKSSIVWEINAETKNSLINSFKDLAYNLANTKALKEEMNFIQKIQDYNEKERQMLFFIKTQLKRYPNWILIYDNIENLSEIKRYFPQDSQTWGNGRVIITTRNINLQNTSYINPENIIQIRELTKEEALTLFCKILFNSLPDKLTKEQREEALEFLKNTPPFPLDVSVAAYYIKDTGSTYEQYLERINQYSKDFEKAQENLLKEISDYTKTRYGIITSSLEKIIQINPKFKKFLFFISLLDSQNIPKDLLEENNNQSVDEFISELKKNGFITSEISTASTDELFSFSIHRSTQAISLIFFKNLLTKEEKEDFVEKMMGHA